MQGGLRRNRGRIALCIELGGTGAETELPTGVLVGVGHGEVLRFNSQHFRAFYDFGAKRCRHERIHVPNQQIPAPAAIRSDQILNRDAGVGPWILSHVAKVPPGLDDVRWEGPLRTRSRPALRR